ncbi:MAG: DUF2726 domain-containing protein [Pirellulaceae bacterium]|nr:DUF2726 domain-containing protein [Pirellulaceae bacterium]
MSIVQKQSATDSAGDNTDQTERDDQCIDATPAFVTKPVLQADERAFLELLRTTMGDQFCVWPKPHLSDFLSLIDASKNLAVAMRLDRKRIPFLICDIDSLQPIGAVRVNLQSSPNDCETHATMDKVLGKAGLPVIHFLTPDDVEPNELQTQLADGLNLDLDRLPLLETPVRDATPRTQTPQRSLLPN